MAWFAGLYIFCTWTFISFELTKLVIVLSICIQVILYTILTDTLCDVQWNVEYRTSDNQIPPISELKEVSLSDRLCIGILNQTRASPMRPKSKRTKLGRFTILGS